MSQATSMSNSLRYKLHLMFNTEKWRSECSMVQDHPFLTQVLFGPLIMSIPADHPLHVCHPRSALEGLLTHTVPGTTPRVLWTEQVIWGARIRISQYARSPWLLRCIFRYTSRCPSARPLLWYYHRFVHDVSTAGPSGYASGSSWPYLATSFPKHDTNCYLGYKYVAII